MKRVWVLGMVIAAALLLVAGCAGEAGKDGADGRDGTDGTNAPLVEASSTETCDFCHADGAIKDLSVAHSIPSAVTTSVRTITITAVSIAAGADTSTVAFNVTEDGAAVTDITATDGTLRFALAQLVPASGGNASYWAPYITRDSTGDLGTVSQGYYERNQTGSSNGTLNISGAASGNYVYTFKKDFGTGALTRTSPGDVASGTNVPFSLTATHRVAIQHSGTGFNPANATSDFRPDGNTTLLATRNIVQTAVCKNCHGDAFRFHGSRTDAQYCPVCHNPTSYDPDTNNVADFKVMIHKIHNGSELPSVVAGGSYIIGGHDYSELRLPQDVRNCETCHQGTGEDKDNWKHVPTAEACESCHDTLNIADAETTHVVGPQTTNAGCFGCHDAGTTAVSTSSTIPKGSSTPNIVTAHSDPVLLDVFGGQYAYVLNDVTYTSSTGALAITYSVTKGGTAQELDSTATAMTPAAEWQNPTSTTTDGANRLYISVGWGDTAQWANDGATSSSKEPGQVVSINALSIGGTGAVNNGAQTYTVTTTLPTAARSATMGVVTIDGHPGVDLFDTTVRERLPVQSTVQNFNIAGTATARPAVVDLAKCDKCHKNLSMHGANRTGNLEVCVVCHNANNTDLSRRVSTAPVGTFDGKVEESIDFKRLIHAMHGAGRRQTPYVVYGYGGTEHVFNEDHVAFPGVLNNCETCHNAPTSSVPSYTVPVSSSLLATTVRSSPSASVAGDSLSSELLDHADDLNISPTTAVCSACHDTNTAAWHMENVGGGSFRVKQANVN